MNGSHLPAGQPMTGVVNGGVGVRGQVDMGPGSHGPGSGRRRGPQYSNHHHHQQQQYHHQQQINHGMYQSSYMNPYAPSYYPQVPHHYHNGTMPSAPYIPYNPYPQRSTPAPAPAPTVHQQYAPIVSSTMQHPPQPYSRPPPQQPSPALSTPPPPYVAAAPAPPIPVPETPSSTHSSQMLPTPLTPPTPHNQEVASTTSEVELRPTQSPFRPPLPWLSRPDVPFPTRSTRYRRKKRMQIPDADKVELPSNHITGLESKTVPDEGTSGDDASYSKTPKPEPATISQPNDTKVESQTQDLPSETAPLASPTAPQSAQPSASSSTPANTAKVTSRPAVPAVPIVPAIPKASPKESKGPTSAEIKSPEENQVTQQATTEAPAKDATAEAQSEPAPAPVKAAPKSWAKLFSPPVPSPSAGPAGTGAVGQSTPPASTATDGAVQSNGGAGAVGFTKSNANSLAEALRTYRVSGGQKIAFLEPRGLINPGNMCYMNSVLQVLIFCIPFYDFLDQVGKKAAYSFKSETPLIDAMIMFMREYKVIDSAVSAEQLCRRLKSEELEQYGEPFTPEFVYEAIRKLPRFASMRRGHQQDAEEFLGFLLEALHDECTHVMRNIPESSAATTAANSSTATPSATSPTSTPDTSDWLEVGRRQRSAVTRSSGHPITSSPITKVFGGQLRSELRVQGLKDSVTLEPFQPLQLDIGSPQVHNIVDALKSLTKPETLHGDFGSPRGKDAVATKQVLIESLPPVLILHLKRFQFDTEGTGTVKIWKKVGYPLELELPKEVFSRQKRNALTAEGAGFPKYRLIAAVYHHGKNASGGHYTVDLRRQDGREWIRMDDTVLRRVRSEDVAEGGMEEGASKTSSRTEKKDATVSGSGNRFEGIGDDEAADDEGWNEVSAPVNGTKKWSSVLNGAPNSTLPKGKQIKDNVKDNKVAYLLFYQRI